jgi:hypothetical protein
VLNWNVTEILPYEYRKSFSTLAVQVHNQYIHSSMELNSKVKSTALIDFISLIEIYKRLFPYKNQEKIFHISDSHIELLNVWYKTGLHDNWRWINNTVKLLHG